MTVTAEGLQLGIILVSLSIAIWKLAPIWFKRSATRDRWEQLDRVKRVKWYAAPPAANHPDRADIERFTRLFMPEHYRREDWK